MIGRHHIYLCSVSEGYNFKKQNRINSFSRKVPQWIQRLNPFSKYVVYFIQVTAIFKIIT